METIIVFLVLIITLSFARTLSAHDPTKETKTSSTIPSGKHIAEKVDIKEAFSTM